MNKFSFISMIAVCSFFLVACNKEFTEQIPSKEEKKETVNKIKEPVYPLIDSRFEKLKLVTLEYVSKRKELLRKEEDCIKKSTNREQMKKCLDDANEERKNVGEKIKNKKKEVRKEPVVNESKENVENKEVVQSK